MMLQRIFAPVKTEMEMLNNSYNTILHHNDVVIKKILSDIALFEGKKLRSAMVFLSAAITGEINQRTHTAAFGVELLHYFSLIHDDVIDNGQKRHNQPTLNATWNNKVAILFGDYLLSECMHEIVQANYPELLLKLADVGKTMAYGELMQLIQAENKCLSEKEYMDIIHCKTATLISACFEMGVASCTSNDEMINQWKIFGETAGIIFQLKDDLLDYQSHNLSQKDAHKDVKEHKFTLPFIFALQQTPDAEKTQLLDLYLNHTGKPEEIQTIIRLVTERGGIAYTESLIDEKTKECIDFINQQKDSEYKKSLLLMIQFIRERKF
jgi:octaprenyl-diphosphate synthase